jgi:hypothetical protein
VGQEYFINSQELEDKVRTLLPSQGGAGAGFDLSASTQIIPIIDLTESAQGSNLRQDLQSAYGHANTTAFNVSNATTTIITTTGYFRIMGNCSTRATNDTGAIITMSITDGSTPKILVNGGVLNIGSGSNYPFAINFDFVVFIDAGDSIVCQTSSTVTGISGVFRQIATIDGELI